MTHNMVEATLGPPDLVNYSSFDDGSRAEVWVYKPSFFTQMVNTRYGVPTENLYVTFKEAKLISVEELYSYEQERVPRSPEREGSGWQNPEPKATPTVSTGTGFAISAEGLIVTAYHVIQDADPIKIHLPNGSVVDANIYQGAPSNDLAILKIDMPTPDYLSLAPLRSAQVGDHVFTVGFPLREVLGQEPKYTDGSISALSGVGGEASFLQISVPIQPGNSGGPLLNDEGCVVGIITASAAILPFVEVSGTLPQNVNWAVKADFLRAIVSLPPQLPKSKNRAGAIEETKNAICLIEAIRNK